MDIIVCKPLDCTDNLSQMSLSYLQMICCRLPAQWTCRVQDGRMICPYLQIMLLSTNLCKRPNLTVKPPCSLITKFSCSFVLQSCIFVSGSTACRVFTLNTVTTVYMHAPSSPFVLQACHLYQFCSWKQSTHILHIHICISLQHPDVERKLFSFK